MNNVYHPHPLQINSGTFWRCDHGRTGFGKDMEWVGCEDCGKQDPDAKYKWDRRALTDTDRLDFLEYQQQVIPIITKGQMHHYSGHLLRDALDHAILASDWYKKKNVHT